jgi:hypothetical protein
MNQGKLKLQSGNGTPMFLSHGHAIEKHPTIEVQQELKV